MMEIERQYRDALNLRIRVLSIAVSVLMAVVAGGFWYVQIVRGVHYAELSENNRLRRLTIRAPRGVIYDRDGEPLVENTPSYNLLIDRSRSTDVESSLEFAAAVLGRSVADMGANLERARRQPDFQPVPVARDLTLAEVARLSAAALEHPEFEIDVGHLRLYRHGAQTAHVLGYLGEISEEELTANAAGNVDGDDRPRYRAGDLIGKKGVERIYDPALRGDDGERSVVVDSRGRLIQEFTRHESVPGTPIHLTLDLDLQQEAERLMRDKVGAVIALDARDGAVLAMVSSPAYDPNVFTRGIRPAEWQALLEDDNDPLQNRGIQNAHSPGSVFKVVMATAGLSEGVITPQTRVHCGGAVVFYGKRFRCWRPGGHGSVDVHKAIAQSCNVYFYTLGKALGIERISKWSRILGLGRPTGIELGGERSGVVPDEQWSARVRNHPWYPGETISVAIGQGAFNVTPIQMARAIAAIANGGRLVTPHLVRVRQPPPVEDLGIEPEVLATVRRAMGGVLEPGGTAHWSGRVDGLQYGGKTGTVQVVAGLIGVRPENQAWEQRNHAWFGSFAPLDDPQIVIVVFNEHGGAGSSGAAPIAAELYRFWFGLRSSEPPVTAG